MASPEEVYENAGVVSIAGSLFEEPELVTGDGEGEDDDLFNPEEEEEEYDLFEDEDDALDEVEIIRHITDKGEVDPFSSTIQTAPEKEAITYKGDNNMSINGNPYRNARNRVVHEVGGTEVTFGQAKLFGLLDAEGNLDKSKLRTGSNPKAHTSQRKHINGLLQSTRNSAGYKEDGSHLLTEEHTFVPKKSEVAMRAMRNPRCGYDFVNRPQDRGDALESLTATNAQNAKKKDNESEKEAYEFKQDKLSCPTCKRFQSFDEYTEKRRSCAQCQVKYVKLNVCDVFSFDKKVKSKEEAKLDSLRRIEEEMYGYEKQPFQAKPVSKASQRSGASAPPLCATFDVKDLKDGLDSKTKAPIELGKALPSAFGSGGKLTIPSKLNKTTSAAISSSLPSISATLESKRISCTPGNIFRPPPYTGPARTDVLKGKPRTTTAKSTTPSTATANSSDEERRKKSLLNVLSEEKKVVKEKKEKMADKFKSLLEY